MVGETVVFGRAIVRTNFPEGQRIIEAVYEIAEFMPLEKGQKSRQPNCWNGSSFPAPPITN